MAHERRKGGHGLLEKYGNSLMKALQAIYPEVEWDSEETSLVAKQHKFLTSTVGYYPLNFVITTR